MKKKIAAVVIVALAAAGIYYRAGRGPAGRLSPMEVSGSIESVEVAVGSTEGGRVVETFVKEGDRLKTGDAIARLENAQLESAVGEAQAAVAVAEAALAALLSGYPKEDIAAARAAAEARSSQSALLEKGTRAEQITAARAEVEAAAAQSENAMLTFERQERLLESGVVSRQTADNARAAARTAEERLNAAKAMLDIALNGPREEEKEAAAGAANEAAARLRKLEKGARAEEIEQARAVVEQARAKLKTIEARAADLVVRAPSPCVVDTMDLHPGDLLAPGGQAAKLALDGDPWIDVYVPADRLSEAKPGAKARIVVDSYPGREFRGTVSRVARSAEFTPRNAQTPEGRASQVFRTRVEVSDPDRELRAGMTAVAVFSSGGDGERDGKR